MMKTIMIFQLTKCVDRFSVCFFRALIVDETKRDDKTSDNYVNDIHI